MRIRFDGQVWVRSISATLMSNPALMVCQTHNARFHFIHPWNRDHMTIFPCWPWVDQSLNWSYGEKPHRIGTPSHDVHRYPLLVIYPPWLYDGRIENLFHHITQKVIWPTNMARPNDMEHVTFGLVSFVWWSSSHVSWLRYMTKVLEFKQITIVKYNLLILSFKSQMQNENWISSTSAVLDLFVCLKYIGMNK